MLLVYSVSVACTSAVDFGTGAGDGEAPASMIAVVSSPIKEIEVSVTNLCVIQALSPPHAARVVAALNCPYVSEDILVHSKISSYVRNHIPENYFAVDDGFVACGVRIGWNRVVGLAFLLWFFQPNNLGNTRLEAKEIISVLPGDFYTTTHTITPYTKLVIGRAMFFAFLILDGTVLVFVWGVAIWLCLSPRRMPKISSFPRFDFAFKTRVMDSGGGTLSREDYARRLFRAGNKETRNICQDMRVSVYKKQ